jgi:hypothetical protein
MGLMEDTAISGEAGNGFTVATTALLVDSQVPASA